MAGRAFAFADPEIIRLAQTAFVPVSADDWYQRRRKDAEGEFFRKVASQGPRKGEGGGTRQGIYILTADGELLAFKNAGQDVKATREQLRHGLQKWNALPANRREAGAVKVEPHGKLDANFTRIVPEGGLVARVHARILDKTADGYAKGATEVGGGDKASRDFLWLTAAEVRQLAPTKLEKDFTYPVPAKIAERIARFHLIDNTRGEPPLWEKKELRKQSFALTVVKVSEDAIELQLGGDVLLCNDADPMKANRGYEATLYGKLVYQPSKQRFTAFDVVAIGEHWGDGDFTRKGTRPGKGLLGIAFGLADPANAADRVSPQGIRERNAYFGNE